MKLWRVTALFGALIISLVAMPTSAADDAAAAYRKIEPSLVKLWAHNASGTPLRSGTGFVVASNIEERWSLIVTAAHVVADADKVTVDIDRRSHNEPATIVSKSEPSDIALVRIERGDLRPVRFAPVNRKVSAGLLVAVAGFFQNDEQIGVTGQAPRLRYPGTVSSLPDNGRYIEIDIALEEGLSGAPVFDPANGDVIAMVQQRVRQGQGGYALPAARGVLPFLEKQRVAISINNLPNASEHAEHAVLMQTSAAPQETALNRAMDGLKAPDPSTRMSTFEQSMSSKDATLRRLALSTALASADTDLRAAALAAAVRSASSFVVDITGVQDADSQVIAKSTNRSFAVRIAAFQPATNTFQASTRYSDPAAPRLRGTAFRGEVLGDRLSFDVDMSSASLFGHRCSAVARLQNGSTSLRGTMSCTNYGNLSDSEGYEIKVEIPH